GMFTPSVPILLEFHKRVQEKKVTCNVRRFDRPLVDVARISLLLINYFELGHHQNILARLTLNPFRRADSNDCSIPKTLSDDMLSFL
ncbi:MAG: hypothetical protein U9N61_06075, partial [Euryarchaeota archaeon]|nr:hypothetical protein [Euryarchaeota archaeon]